MNYNELIKSINGYDLQAAPVTVRIRFLRLLLRATATLAAAERVEPKFKSALKRISENLRSEAFELAESFRFSSGNVMRPTFDALRSTAAERLDRSLKRGRGAVIFCGRHKLAARILEVVK
ncbi:MAG: hypothetical protein J6K25_04990 [Thermoguttaceae bacterium]|nr:hypothetical protein [Thermoguttaceae bacterium]